MTFDGETVSLNPSIENWTLRCRSHYVIKRGQVIEAGPWTDKQVEAERNRDRIAKAKYYRTTDPIQSAGESLTQKKMLRVQALTTRVKCWLQLW